MIKRSYLEYKNDSAMLFKLDKNLRSSIENQLAQSDTSLNADQKW